TLYEIKPYRSYDDAVTQLNKYLTAFRMAHVRVTAGPSDAPGATGIVSAPGGYAAFASPAPGIILYRKFNGTFNPATAQNTVPLTVPNLNGVFVVVSIFGILIEIVNTAGQVI